MNRGELREWIVIERAQQVSDWEAGEPAWVEVCSRWAKYEPAKVTQDTQNQTVQNVSRAMFTAESVPDVREGDRIRWAARLFHIEQARELDSDGQWYALEVTEVR